MSIMATSQAASSFLHPRRDSTLLKKKIHGRHLFLYVSQGLSCPFIMTGVAWFLLNKTQTNFILPEDQNHGSVSSRKKETLK